MPEWPDVILLRRYLDAAAPHRQVDRVRVTRDDVLHHLSARRHQAR